jgi:hypothetical protein
MARRWLDGGKVLSEISRGVTGKVPSKEERAGAHQNGGSTVRRRKRRWVAGFVGGEGAPVGGDDGCEVRGVVDGGGARPESVRRRGFWWPEAAVQAWEAVGRVGRSRGAVGEEWRRENERGSERGGNGSAAA